MQMQMILTVPHGFNAEYFCHIVSTLANDGKEHSERTDYDLGECASSRLSQTQYFDEYEIDAGLIDLETIDIICKLQELCPLVGFYFKGNAAENRYDPYAEDYYSEAYYYLFKYAGVPHVKSLG